MANNLYSHFRKVDHYGDNTLSTELELNLKWYLDWSFLKIGGWTNIDSGVTQAPFGGNFYDLKPVYDPSYSNGQVWEGPRKDWCFETEVNYETVSFDLDSVEHVSGGTGLVTTINTHYLHVGDILTISNNAVSAYNDTFTVVEVLDTNQLHVITVPDSGNGFGGSYIAQVNPLPVSISVDGEELTDVNLSGFEYHINYPLGRVIFDEAKPTGTTSVVAEYSYRSVQTYISDSVPWMVEFQFDSLRPDHPNWENIDFMNKGEWAMNAQHRIQLPAVIIESTEYQGGRPFQLGNVSLWENPQVIFHVLAENRFERNKLVNILMNQKHHSIYLFQSRTLLINDYYPLDYRGMLVTNPMMYENIVVNMHQLRWLTCWFKDMVTSEVKTQNPNLHYARVRATFEVVIADD